MNRANNAVNKFLKKHACSQAILSEYCEQYGLNKEVALKIASGFAAGMRMGSVCGAVTGAYMVLGLKYSEENCEKSEGRENVYKAVTEFTKEFEKVYGSVECKKLLGCDVGTKEGMQAAVENNLFQTACPKFVETSARLLEPIIEDN